jgi:hypothetical protein
MKQKTTLLLAAFIAIMITGCATPTVMKTPDGFARFDKERNFRAASPDGVTLVAYPVSERGVDEKSAEKTWIDEIDRVMKSKGYVFVTDQNLAMNNGLAGYYCEYEVLYNGEPFIYACLFVKKTDKLYICEAGGPKKNYLTRKDSIIDWMKSWDVK